MSAEVHTTTNATPAAEMFVAMCSGHYEPYETYIPMGLVALPIIAFGMIANTMSMIIFAHKAMAKAPINWYLLVLSVSDFLVLVTSLLFLTLPRFGQIVGAYSLVRVSYLLTPYLYALGNLLQTNSVYMTVAVATHRFIGVCFPFVAGRLLNNHRVRVVICSVIVFSVMFNLPRFFEVQISADCWYSDINESLPLLGPTDLRMNLTYLMLFHGWTYSLVMFFAPFGALIVMNSAVMRVIHRTRKRHAALMSAHAPGRPMANGNGSYAQEHNDDDDDEFMEHEKRREVLKELRTSVMLVSIVLLFLVCNALALVLNLWENLVPGGHGWIYSKLVSVSNLLIVVNSSANIAIYALFSHKYRVLLVYYTSCRWTAAESETMIPLNSMPDDR